MTDHEFVLAKKAIFDRVLVETNNYAKAAKAAHDWGRAQKLAEATISWARAIA